MIDPVTAVDEQPTVARPAGEQPALRPVRWYLPLIALVAVSLGLAALSYVTPTFGGGHPIYARDGEIGNYVNVDEEANLPTWWGTLLLAGGGLAYLGGAWVARATRARGTVAWTLVGVLLLAMSLDEATQLHENLARLEGLITTPFANDYAWLMIGIPLALAAVAIVLVSGVRLPLRTLGVLLLGFVVFFAGAVGLEAVQSVDVSTLPEARAAVRYHQEEVLEMVGACLIAVAPLAGLLAGRGPGGVTLRLSPRLRVGRARRRPRVAR